MLLTSRGWQVLDSGPGFVAASPAPPAPRYSHEELYRRDPAVFAAVNVLAHYTSILPAKLYRGPATDRERITDHELSRLLQAPSPGKTWYQFCSRVLRQLAIHARAYAEIEHSAEGIPTGLRALDTLLVKAQGDEYHVTRPDGSTSILPASSVLAFEMHGGISPLEPLRQTLETEAAAAQYSAAAFRNNSRPGGIVSVKGAPGSGPDSTELEAFQQQLNAKYQGPENAGKLVVVDGDVAWTPFSYTAQESELIAHRQLALEAVARAFHIPAALLNDLKRMTFSNVAELLSQFYKGTLAPWLLEIESVIQAQLINSVPDWQGLKIELDQSAQLRGSVTERSAAYMQFAQAAVYTANELRALENLPPLSDPRASVPGGFHLNMAGANPLPLPEMDSDV